MNEQLIMNLASWLIPCLLVNTPPPEKKEYDFIHQFVGPIQGNKSALNESASKKNQIELINQLIT